MGLAVQADEEIILMVRFFIALLVLITLIIPLNYARAGIFDKKPEKLKNDLPLEDLTAMYERKVFKPEDKKRKLLTYFWFQPATPYPEGIKFPLVLILHGAPGNAYAGKFLVSPEMQTTYPAFIIVPALSLGSIWISTKTDPVTGKSISDAANYEVLPDIVSLIKDLAKKYPIDQTRIYVMGCSEGGVGSFGAALHYPEVFAAALPISGAWKPEDAPKMTKIPIWAIHGAKDTVIPPHLSGDVIRLIQEYGGPAYYTEFPSMKHECPASELYSPQIWAWLFKQKK